jgi:DNA-binding NtrC family response regulator
MPELDGLGLLKRIKENHPHTAVVVMTAFSTWESAVEAMRLGAFNYIRKPFDNDEIRSIVRRAVEAVENEKRIERGEETFVYRQIIGNTPDMRNIQDLIKRVAPTDSTVCIQGESGTGKELVARAIHAESSRRYGRFIAVNCAAFTETLLESELFGHVRGAFTGAVSDKQGLFEVAQGGTFFLDEVAEMSRPLQTRLLRALEEREIKPVGSTESVKIDVRVVAATNKKMTEEVKRGTFREDLFYRLNVIPVTVPPLRERKGDIPFLVGHFLGKYAMSMGKKVTGITREALDMLFEQDWPGNVRELENTIQRAVALATGRDITPGEITERSSSSTPLPTDARTSGDTLLPPGGIRLENQLEDLERAYIQEALRRCDNVVTRAADLLHINVRALRYRIKKLDLRPAKD